MKKAFFLTLLIYLLGSHAFASVYENTKKFDFETLNELNETSYDLWQTYAAEHGGEDRAREDIFSARVADKRIVTLQSDLANFLVSSTGSISMWDFPVEDFYLTQQLFRQNMKRPLSPLLQFSLTTIALYEAEHLEKLTTPTFLIWIPRDRATRRQYLYDSVISCAFDLPHTCDGRTPEEVNTGKRVFFSQFLINVMLPTACESSLSSVWNYFVAKELETTTPIKFAWGGSDYRILGEAGLMTCAQQDPNLETRKVQTSRFNDWKALVTFASIYIKEK